VRVGVKGELGDEEKRDRLNRIGLHFCRRYRNLVRYNPEFCEKCPFNGMRGASSPHSETCF